MNENTKAMLEKRYQNERLEEIEYTIKTFPEQGKYLIDLLEEKKTIRAEGTTTRRGCIDALKEAARALTNETNRIHRPVINDWEKYGKSRTYFKINGADYGYFDNISAAYVACENIL